jgi:hypothetical protein
MARTGRTGNRRNVTITLDEDVARWVRVKAAEADTSVARLVGDMLKEQMRRDGAYEAAMREYFAIIQPRPRSWADGRRPTRDELHDRSKLRS